MLSRRYDDVANGKAQLLDPDDVRLKLTARHAAYQQQRWIHNIASSARIFDQSSLLQATRRYRNALVPAFTYYSKNDISALTHRQQCCLSVLSTCWLDLRWFCPLSSLSDKVAIPGCFGQSTVPLFFLKFSLCLLARGLMV